jgi:hypothetical protein
VAFLAGPAVPLESALQQMARSQRAEPFGLELSSTLSPVESALAQLAGLMHRFMGILESLIQNQDPPMEDDFMKGWGEPGGDIES